MTTDFRCNSIVFLTLKAVRQGCNFLMSSWHFGIIQPLRLLANHFLEFMRNKHIYSYLQLIAKSIWTAYNCPIAVYGKWNT